MRPKTHKVYLTASERVEMQKLVKAGVHSAEKIRRANILLQLDENYPPVKTQQEIANNLQTTASTVSQTAFKFSQIRTGCIERKERAEPPITPIVTGEVEAHIIAINCSEPPKGRNKWTLQMTAERLIELKIVPKISKDTVSKALKKTNLNPI